MHTTAHTCPPLGRRALRCRVLGASRNPRETASCTSRRSLIPWPRRARGRDRTEPRFSGRLARSISADELLLSRRDNRLVAAAKNRSRHLEKQPHIRRVQLRRSETQASYCCREEEDSCVLDRPRSDLSEICRGFDCFLSVVRARGAFGRAILERACSKLRITCTTCGILVSTSRKLPGESGTWRILCAFTSSRLKTLSLKFQPYGSPYVNGFRCSASHGEFH